MQLVKHAGKTKQIHLPVTGSTALKDGCPVKFSGGLLVAAATGDSHDVVIGVLRKEIAATDDDYATSARLVPVEVPVEKCVEWKVGTSAAVTAATHRGNEYDLTVTSGVPTVNLSGTTDKLFRIIKLVGADTVTTTVIVHFKVGGSY